MKKLLLFPALLLCTLVAFGVTPSGSGTATNPWVFNNIDQYSGWGSCDSCAGTNGAGPTAPHSMSATTSPSLDGDALKFFIGGSTPYSDVMWWNSVNRTYSMISHAHNFILDFYFYLTNPAAPHALEFAVTQYVNGHKLNFGMQCNMGGDGKWDLSSGGNWHPSAAPCLPPAPYVWHHVTMQFQRVSGDYLRYVSINYDGHSTALNTYYAPHSTSGTNLTFHYQMDGNASMTNYYTWLDKVKLIAW